MDQFLKKLNLYQAKGLVCLGQLQDRILKSWNSKAASNTIFRNMTVLAGGVGIARIIGLLSTPVITRIYLPEHMGVLAVFASLAAMLLPFGTLRFSMAIPLPKNEKLATNLAVLCVIILFAVTLFTTITFSIFAPNILKVLSMNALVPFWFLLPLALAVVGLYEILSSWAIRTKAFTQLAKTKVWQSIIGPVVKISFGILGLKPLGLLIGHILTQGGGVVSLFRNFYKSFKSTWKYISLNRMVFLFNYYASFPKYRLPSQFLMVLSQKALLLFCSWQFDAYMTGQVGLAVMVLALPISLVGQTTGQAYYSEIAKIGRKHPEEIYKITKNITKKLFLVSILPYLVLQFFGPILFELVFGPNWRDAGVFGSILAVYLLATFSTVPIMNVLNIFNQQKTYLVLNIIRFALILAIFSLLFHFGSSIHTCIVVFSLSLSVYFVATFLVILAIIKRKIKCLG
jgi:O-antigen/teichoic acid export membrane protein